MSVKLPTGTYNLQKQWELVRDTYLSLIKKGNSEKLQKQLYQKLYPLFFVIS